MANLIVEIVEGEDAGRQVPLTDALEVGRDRSLALPLDDEQASRHHARLSVQQGRVVLEDLGSTNGTFVNDQPIHAARAIASGDRVRIGLTVLELRDSQQVARQSSAVRPTPDITVVGHDVLQPAAPEELAPPAVLAPGLAAEETEPAFVPREVIGDREAEVSYAAVQRLIDTRVKRQTTRAVFALLGAAGIAVLLAFGLK